MNGLSQLGTALAVVFSVLLVAILAEICYVFHRRRKFHQRNRVEDDSEYSNTDPDSNRPSKELQLYFFCWRIQNPFEPEESPITRDHPDAPPLADEGNVLNWRGLYGPSRILFTIKEEERDEVDSSMEKTAEVVSLEEECFGGVDEATPFSTPCASPFYYTPAASPTREATSNGGGNLTDPAEIERTVAPVGVCGESTVPFVSLEVHSD